jgi:hypothetical protein
MSVVRCVVLGSALLVSLARAGEPRVYDSRLSRMDRPHPILAAYPEFVDPIQESVHYEAPTLVNDPGADLSVRAWRFCYNARGIIEIPNRLKGADTAVVVVHPWGIDDGSGWQTPEPAGVAMFCTPEKNRIYHRHVRQVVNPFLKSLRGKVGLVVYSLPGTEDPIRKKLYRSVRSRPTERERRQGARELERKLRDFAYKGGPLPSALAFDRGRPATAEYFRQQPALDSSARFDGEGFWNQPIPVVKEIERGADDVVVYDGEGYPVLRDFLKKQGIRHVLLAGYCTDMCVCSTTAGYQNLAPDFNLFVVGDATLATFPARTTPRGATAAALAKVSLSHLVTQVSWVRPQ